MTIVVMRILADNLVALQDIKGEVVRHIPHQYSKEMCERSTVVSIFDSIVWSQLPDNDLWNGVFFLYSLWYVTLCIGQSWSSLCQPKHQCWRAWNNGSPPWLCANCWREASPYPVRRRWSECGTHGALPPDQGEWEDSIWEEKPERRGINPQ